MTDNDRRSDLNPSDTSVVWIWLIALASAVAIGVVFRFLNHWPRARALTKCPTFEI